MRDHRWIGALALTLLAFCIAGIAQAQAPAWDTNVVTFTPPNACTNGQPLTACPVTGYRIERAATGTGTFTTVGTATSSPFTHTGAASGTNCYRVIALAETNSDPSNVFCKTNTRPAPNPPTITVVALTAGDNVTPAYRILEDGSRSSPYYALAPVGTACEGPCVFNYRGNCYRRVTLTQADLVGTSSTANLAAPCS